MGLKLTDFAALRSARRAFNYLCAAYQRFFRHVGPAMNTMAPAHSEPASTG
jgi:sulfatase maturation enzyme AslB (radical SAM superfamily)